MVLAYSYAHHLLSQVESFARYFALKGLEHVVLLHELFKGSCDWSRQKDSLYELRRVPSMPSGQRAKYAVPGLLQGVPTALHEWKVFANTAPDLMSAIPCEDYDNGLIL